jgi:hypothetical protein
MLLYCIALTAVRLPYCLFLWYPLHLRPLRRHYAASFFPCPSRLAPICLCCDEGMGWRMWPCFLRTPRDAPWPIDTTAVVFVVGDVFIPLSLLLGGVSILFET